VSRKVRGLSLSRLPAYGLSGSFLHELFWIRVMGIRDKVVHITLLVSAVLVLWLVWGTGIHGDDYLLLNQIGRLNIGDLFRPDLHVSNVNVFSPVGYFFNYFPYYLFGKTYLLGYDLYKFLSAVCAGFMAYRFVNDYLPRARALLAVAMFILLPIHDTTLFWHLTHLYVLTPAVIMYAHHLVRRDQYKVGFLAGMCGAFSSFVSPPYTFGLGAIFILEQKWKKAFVFFVPGLLYVVFYFYMTNVLKGHPGRISSHLDGMTFFKQYLLQMASFLDVAVGPSFWLKLIYSANAVTVGSLVLGLIVLAIFVRCFDVERIQYPATLIGGALAVTMLAFGMFALTGFYPQIAFNLGNRVTTFGSLLLAFGVAVLPLSRRQFTIVAAVLLVSVLGLSDHWRSWNARQLEVIHNLQTNTELAKVEPNSTILVVGHHFSKLGPFAHVDFFCEDPVQIFAYALGQKPDYAAYSVSRRHYVQEHDLVDKKWGKVTQLSDEVIIYDAETNSLRRIASDKLNDYLSALPLDVRHWVQLLDDGWTRRTVIYLMPRLEYLFV